MYLEILLLPFRYNLLFYINPQFYGYAAITKVLLQNIRLNCEYESTLSCISTDGNAVLTRFGLETVNPYEHLVVCALLNASTLLPSSCFPGSFPVWPNDFSGISNLQLNSWSITNKEFICLSLSFISVNPFRLTWSERKSEVFPRLRHRNELIVRAWEKAVQGLSKRQSMRLPR